MFVRHGVAANHATGAIALPEHALTERGETALRRLASTWTGSVPERFFSSDLRRGRESAAILGARWKVELECDARLREMSFGLWEGMSWKEVARAYPNELNEWSK